MNIKTRFSKKEHVDSGLALLLLTLVLTWWFNSFETILLAIAEIIAILIAPVLIYPFTFLWLNISEMLGRIMSKIILTIIYIVFVCPVAIFRKSIGKDTLMLKKFKKNDNSVLIDRNHSYTKTDFTTQY